MQSGEARSSGTVPLNLASLIPSSNNSQQQQQQQQQTLTSSMMSSSYAIALPETSQAPQVIFLNGLSGQALSLEDLQASNLQHHQGLNQLHAMQQQVVPLRLSHQSLQASSGLGLGQIVQQQQPTQFLGLTVDGQQQQPTQFLGLAVDGQQAIQAQLQQPQQVQGLGHLASRQPLGQPLYQLHNSSQVQYDPQPMPQPIYHSGGSLLHVGQLDRNFNHTDQGLPRIESSFLPSAANGHQTQFQLEGMSPGMSPRRHRASGDDSEEDEEGDKKDRRRTKNRIAQRNFRTRQRQMLQETADENEGLKTRIAGLERLVVEQQRKIHQLMSQQGNQMVQQGNQMGQQGNPTL